MNKELLINMFYAAPELWYSLGVLLLAFLVYIFWLKIKILKLNQKNYFINRDRERYAETLYASKDGYFAFIYPDTKVNDPVKGIKERCSRRLAVLLNLENGKNSQFEDVLRCFYKDDAKKIIKYFDLLREEGVPFEEDFITKNDNRYIRLNGCRITNNDGSTFCDMIWFRDVTEEKSKVSNLVEEKEGFFNKIIQLEDMINNLPYPAWLRNNNLDIVLANKKYYDFLDRKNKNPLTRENIEICDANGESISKNLAFAAISNNRVKSDKTNIVVNGQINVFEVSETPFYSELTLDKISSVGTLINVSELEEIKLKHKLGQNALLDILGSLGSTAFAVFNGSQVLSFYNKSFAKMWQLEEIWLKSNPTYSTFLDTIREKRLLPEVPNFVAYKEDENKALTGLIEPKEDLLHLPDSRTIRRLRAGYPNGGTILAFEDVSDRLATRRAYNSLFALQQDIIDNVSEALLIFDASGRLKFYNREYITLWHAPSDFLNMEPNILELVDSQKDLLSFEKDWESLRKEILNHITSLKTNGLILSIKDQKDIQLFVNILSDDSIMITYRTI
ncbi:MAG: PAS-domain containing protein [Alphaproteobacteria bacterium]|nr:PAS-domain containing protein [Alphaproteobacteria bacterium]